MHEKVSPALQLAAPALPDPEAANLPGGKKETATLSAARTLQQISANKAYHVAADL